MSKPISKWSPNGSPQLLSLQSLLDHNLHISAETFNKKYRYLDGFPYQDVGGTEMYVDTEVMSFIINLGKHRSSKF